MQHFLLYSKWRQGNDESNQGLLKGHCLDEDIGIKLKYARYSQFTTLLEHIYTNGLSTALSRPKTISISDINPDPGNRKSTTSENCSGSLWCSSQFIQPNRWW